MLKKILSTTVILGGLVFAQSVSATSFDFAAYADDPANPNYTGETGAPWFAFTEDGLTVEILAGILDTETEAYPYLDEHDAGLGVCKELDKDMECDPRHDDNLTDSEVLGLWFYDAEGNETEVTITDIIFKNLDHKKYFDENATYRVFVDGNEMVFNLSHMFATDLTGHYFSFATGEEETEYYINALNVTHVPVPAPAPLALLALGLLGIYGAAQKLKP